ncbi:MAG: RNA polymerase sigma factor, partial [Ignavibacteriales bacterium]|nr:RNA polymerase sigma factor [Ignavibacteriales bacterium]
RGDIDALQTLFFRYDKTVLSIAARYVNHADDAKDIYQEVFLRVYKGIRQFEQRSEFSTWLYRIATNVCLTHKERSRRTNDQWISAYSDEEDVDTGAVNDDRESPFQKTADADLTSSVDEALDELSPRQKMVFVLKHYEGHKILEIAQMLDCSEGTVKKYLFEATRRLRERLQFVRQ